MARRSRIGEESLVPVYHPAGFDVPLRTALQEMEAARWAAIRDLLDATGSDWGLRTSRSQVLAAAAARASHDIVGAWLDEEPDCTDAHVMRARVLVQRALDAHHRGQPRARALVEAARTSCYQAHVYAPADPVPLVAWLALGVTDVRFLYREFWLPRTDPMQPPETSDPMLPPGPWGLWSAIWERHPYNREAAHQLLRCASRPGTGAPPMVLARWVTSWADPGMGAALLMLPLYAAVETFRQYGESSPLLRRQWADYPVRRDVLKAADGADLRADPHVSVSDLNYLAHALFSAGEYTRAADVFEVLGCHFTRAPWAYNTLDPSQDALAAHEFLRVRSICLSPARTVRARDTAPPGPAPP
ncbi:hypothetical protein [Streptomyces sp. TLI_146]|uniref:hypothetical protein n=1 Tax=Streptomyces sp. TLI_146 TaxID=1938858 RepID=UPI000C70817A|nr:hypothetical protein [Streptomyces sp. TLI_146]PKV82689.1 hypothetical protein BX283_0134 [Streptomyces sp. TLI_146]